jgi:hypothetical protein
MKRVGFVLVLLFLSTAAFAQNQYEGSAKFVCGKTGQDVVDAYAFAPGVYYTSINVTNPDFSITVNGRKQFSVGLLRQKPGPYTQWVPWTLKPGESMQVDCSDIYSYLNIPVGTFIDGFVHIVGAPVRYDVTGVYTVTDGSRIVSQDVEEVTLR